MQLVQYIIKDVSCKNVTSKHAQQNEQSAFKRFSILLTVDMHNLHLRERERERERNGNVFFFAL